MSLSAMLLFAGTVALSLWATMRVRQVFGRFSQLPASSGLSGAETAATILRQEGIYDVEIVEHDQMLGDHYDPMHKRLVLELSDFIQIQARALSLGHLDELIVDLLALRERFTEISAQPYPYLADQLEFLSLVVESQADGLKRDPVPQMLAEASFALLYFQRTTDLIPDSITGLDLLDDAVVVSMVLRRHAHAFKCNSHADKLRWPFPTFDVDQLLWVVSPLRVTSFCSSLAIGPASLTSHAEPWR